MFNVSVFMINQGGFQNRSNNNSPAAGVADGAVRVKKERKSNVIIPVTIMQLQNALESTVPGDGVNIDGIEVHNVYFIATILSMTSEPNLNFTMDDSTGQLNVKMYIPQDQGTSENPQRTLLRERIYVRVDGYITVAQSSNVRRFTASSIKPIEDFNEITHHNLMVIKSHLERVRPTNTATSSNSMQGIVDHNGAKKVSNSDAGLHDQIMNFLRAQNSSTTGVTVATLVQYITGYSEQQIHNAVVKMGEEGFLYATGDDEHFKAL